MSTNPRDTQISIALRNCGAEIARAVVNARESCLDCEHFNEKGGELCSLAGQRPPARVIAYGCPSYMPQIPF